MALTVRRNLGSSCKFLFVKTHTLLQGGGGGAGAGNRTMPRERPSLPPAPLPPSLLPSSSPPHCLPPAPSPLTRRLRLVPSPLPPPPRRATYLTLCGRRGRRTTKVSHPSVRPSLFLPLSVRRRLRRTKIVSCENRAIRFLRSSTLAATDAVISDAAAPRDAQILRQRSALSHLSNDKISLVFRAQCRPRFVLSLPPSDGLGAMSLELISRSSYFAFIDRPPIPIIAQVVTGVFSARLAPSHAPLPSWQPSHLPRENRRCSLPRPPSLLNGENYSALSHTTPQPAETETETETCT